MTSWFRVRRLTPVALVLLLLLAPATGTAQNVSKVGTTAGAFLQIGVGPRATALGGAFVATADDASALYWNPAGVAALRHSEVIAVHSEWLGDLDFDYLGAALDLGNAGTVGLSVTMLSVPDMMVRTEDRQEGTGEMFDAGFLAAGLTYARAVTDRFSIGATVKFVQERIWHTSAQTVAVDLGTRFRTDFFGGLTIGAALYNFGGDLQLDGRDLRTFVDPDRRQLGNNDRVGANYETDPWSLPLDFQLGLSTTPLYTRMHQLTLAVDAQHPSSNYESLNAGVEYGFQERFFLRGGLHRLFLEDHEGGLSGGVAVHQPLPYDDGLAKLEYAYRAVGRLGGIHMLGLGVTF